MLLVQNIRILMMESKIPVIAYGSSYFNERHGLEDIIVKEWEKHHLLKNQSLVGGKRTQHQDLRAANEPIRARTIMRLNRGRPPDHQQAAWRNSSSAPN